MGEGSAADHAETEVLIDRYDLEMCPPACVPGSATWSARAVLDGDIEAVLPYLNARLGGADYDHAARVLVWKDHGHSFAFRSREIKAAPALDREEAKALIDRAVVLANQAWREREHIEPRHERRSRPNLMQVYRLLPHTNCGHCGCATCMAFAAEVREGERGLALCAALDEPEHAENRRVLLEMLEPFAARG
jgi:ArsR family metal-binding transcriptional regulator